MADAEHEEVVILTDSDGEYYVVSKATIERGKLEGELKDAIVDAAEAEVSAFSFSFGRTQFTPVKIAEGKPPVQGGFGIVGTFDYQVPQAVNIAKTVMPGR
jgi:hypothetical protein